MQGYASFSGKTARPRISSVGGLYVPPTPVLRAGSDKHLDLPSIVNGRPVARVAPFCLGSSVEGFAALKGARG